METNLFQRKLNTKMKWKFIWKLQHWYFYLKAILELPCNTELGLVERLLFLPSSSGLGDDDDMMITVEITFQTFLCLEYPQIPKSYLLHELKMSFVVCS